MRAPTLLFPLLAAAALAGPSAQAAGDARLNIAGTHCKAGERVAYSCAFGKKVVSVCITRGESVTYRYGPLGRPEMVVASTGRDGKAHRNEVMLAAGGNQQHLRFTSGGYEYIVYSGITGPGFDLPNERSSGLVVLKGEDQVADKACARNGELQRIPYDDTRFIAEDPDETFEQEY